MPALRNALTGARLAAAGLAGAIGSVATVNLRSPDGGTAMVVLRRNPGLPERGPAPAIAFELTRQRFVHFGRHPSGMGYIRIESFSGGGEIADEFDRALEALRNTPGLIVDIRDNRGGFGQPRMVGRLLQKSALTTATYIKKGARTR